MAEAISIKKAVRRLAVSADRLRAADEQSLESALHEFHLILGEIEENWVSGELSGDDSSIVEIYRCLEILRDVDGKAYSNELDFVLSFITNSSDIWGLKLRELNSSDRYESILELLSEERNIKLDEESLEILFRASRALGRFETAALYLSERDVFYEPIFRALVDNGETRKKTTILGNFYSNNNDEAAYSFLNLLKFDKNDMWARLRILELLEKKGRGDLIEEIDNFPFEDISDLQEFRNLGYLLMRNRLPETTVKMASSGLKMFPDDYELLKIKAEALRHQGEKVESYEIFKQLALRDNSDLSVIKSAISLSLEQDLFEECHQLIETYPDSKKDPNVMAQKAECELQMSKFTEALRDLDQALQENKGHRKLIELKLRTLIKLNKESEAFHLAREVMEEDPENEEASTYAMNWLYKRGEYNTIVDFCEDSEILRHNFRPLFVACKILEDDIKDARKDLQEEPELLNAPKVVDAIFFNVREDDELSKFDSIYSELADKKPYYSIVSGRIRGIRPRQEAIEDEVIKENESQAIAYILSHEYYSSRSPEVPDRIRSMLYQPAFKEIRALLEFLTYIYEGKISEDVVDSSRYLFPLTEALIKLEMLDKAESQLERSIHRENDPFYRYSLALIDFHKGEYNSSRKYVENAIDHLKNADFLKLALNIAVLTDDSKDFRNYLDEIVEMNLIDTFDFSELYNNISANSLWDIASILVGIETEASVSNPWIVRVKRDMAIQSKDYSKALESSSVLFSTNQYTKDDVNVHIDIMDKLGKNQEIVNFLLDIETGNTSNWLEKVIGDAYFKASKYNNSLEHYNMAIELGIPPEELENYADALLESEKFDEATEFIEKTSNKLLQLKLYGKTSNIRAAIDLLNSLTFKQDEDQEIVKYAADNLWYNTDIRDLVISLYKREGYTWLGKLIAIKTFENKDTRLSLEVAKNLNKNSPDDLEIVGLYSNLLIRAGEREEAIQLLLDSMKYCGDFTKCMDLTNTLLRLYYEDRAYDDVIKFYETNPKFVDERSLQYVIRSYMEADNFDMAEKLMSRYEGTLLSKDTHSELREDLKTKKEFMETIFYVSRLLKVEYKVGKKFDRKEAFYKADVPIEQIEAVYQFLNSRDFYFDVNEEKYELLTRDVIQKAVKGTNMESIGDLTIAAIFNNLDRKDPIIARNVYIYIKDQMDIARRPKLKDDALLKLLRIALRENIKQEPLHIAFYLKIGISEALEVMTLMEYMSKMNQEGDI